MSSASQRGPTLARLASIATAILVALATPGHAAAGSTPTSAIAGGVVQAAFDVGFAAMAVAMRLGLDADLTAMMATGATDWDPAGRRPAPGPTIGVHARVAAPSGPVHAELALTGAWGFEPGAGLRQVRTTATTVLRLDLWHGENIRFGVGAGAGLLHVADSGSSVLRPSGVATLVSFFGDASRPRGEVRVSYLPHRILDWQHVLRVEGSLGLGAARQARLGLRAEIPLFPARFVSGGPRPTLLLEFGVRFHALR